MGSSHSSNKGLSFGGGGGSCIDSGPVVKHRRGHRKSLSDGDAATSSKELVNYCGLSLIFAGAAAARRRQRRRRDDERNGAENNDSWLLADTRAQTMGGTVAAAEADPFSVHSSFRFSFGSQMEAEEIFRCAPQAAAAATVLLLVNLEEDGEEVRKRESGKEQQQQQQCRRMEILERCVSSAMAAAAAPGGLIRFSYAEILSAAQGFSEGSQLHVLILPGRELGRGGLSRVFKGRIGVRRRAVAIKRVEGQDRESIKAFCRELMIASSLRHANVVPLLGFCIEKKGLFLVYKYVSGRSLDRHLHREENKKGRKVLPWDARYKVAIGTARALQYLHQGTNKCIIHRDVKPSNILLSSNQSPKLCDFGLATWTNAPSLPFLCKSVKGTFGYLAPEYFQNGKLSDKTDVYAFGVVLLELITGRRAIDTERPLGEENLVLWAKPHLKHAGENVFKFLDPRLKQGQCNPSKLSRMIHTAIACVNSDELERPSMDKAIEMLQGGEDASSEWSIFTGNGCLAAYGTQSYEPPEKSSSDMRSHLALAMLGVSDDDEELYTR